MLRALGMLALLALTAAGDAKAQTGGIQVAPVMVTMTPERAISSLRLRNGRDRPVAFEIDVYAWSQSAGHDELAPASDLVVAPGVFEIPAAGEQTVRLGFLGAAAGRERAFRILIRELPRAPENGPALGFTLEMSLPVFVTPRDADAEIAADVIDGALVLTNSGDAHAQIALTDAASNTTLPGPRYLLAESSARVELPPRAEVVRLNTAGPRSEPRERTIHVNRQDRDTLVR